MQSETKDKPQLCGPPTTLPKRRLLIVRELDQFATDGEICWTPELVETFLDWSDLRTDAPGVYRLAFVSEKLTTAQVDGEGDRSFTKPLSRWNNGLPVERQLHLAVQFGNTAASYLGYRDRHDGVSYPDRIGRIEFFTREYFERVKDVTWRGKVLGGWHNVIERSLRSHDVSILNWWSEGEQYPDRWLEAGYVHQSSAYRDIIILDNGPDGLTYKHFTV